MTRTRVPPPGQLDLFALLEPEPEPAPPPARCLYHSAARGLRARGAEIRAAMDQDDVRPIHGWAVAMCCPSTPTDRCQLTILSADTRPWHDGDTWPCGCHTIDELQYRGACLHCDWEGPVRGSEKDAAFDGCDHAWPGWRDLPVVTSMPYDQKQEPRWVAKVTAVYPAGWLEAGGPIRTLRQSSIGSRPHDKGTPFGGYDVGVLASEVTPA